MHMRILNFIIIYVVVLALGMGAIALGVPQTAALWFFTIAAIVLVIGYMYAMTSTKNTKLTLFAIKFQKRSPMFAYVFAIKDGTLEDELEAIELVKKKVKNPETVYDYEFLGYIRQKDLVNAYEIIKQMKSSPRKRLNIAIYEAEAGKYGMARSHDLDFIWMEDYIEAYVANLQGNKERYEEYMQKTIEGTKGLQRLTNEAIYARDLREWDAAHQKKKKKK